MHRRSSRLLHPLRWLMCYRGIPRMSRPTFRYEFIGNLLAHIGGGVFIPPLAQAFAKDDLGGPDWIVPVLGSAVVAFHLVGVAVPRLLRRRRRVPYMVACRLGCALSALVISLLPMGPDSLLPYTAMVFVAFLCASVSINVQASIWHANYPEDTRGRVVTRLLSVRLVTVAASSILAGAAFDGAVWGYRLAYGVAGACFVASAWSYSHIRVRREKALLAESHRRPTRIVHSIRVLWQDPTFGKYMALQFLGGGANLLVGTAVLLLAVKDTFSVNYKDVAGSFAVVPMLLTLAVTPFSGVLYDRMKLMRLRALGMCLWGTTRLWQFLALLAGNWPLLVAGFAVQGITAGTTGVLWNVGHTRFAPPGQSEKYMGIHSTLTGVRGLIMPFVGYALYTHPGVGLTTILVSAIVIFLSAGGFVLLPEPRADAGNADTA